MRSKLRHSTFFLAVGVLVLADTTAARACHGRACARCARRGYGSYAPAGYGSPMTAGYGMSYPYPMTAGYGPPYGNPYMYNYFPCPRYDDAGGETSPRVATAPSTTSADLTRLTARLDELERLVKVDQLGVEKRLRDLEKKLDDNRDDLQKRLDRFEDLLKKR